MTFESACPLAVRLASDILATHSIPDNVLEFGFDTTIFERKLVPQDFAPHGAAFRLVWGRDYREANIRKFCELTRARLVIHGHECCPDGSRHQFGLQIMLDCCGDRACVLELPLQHGLTNFQIGHRVERL